MIGPAVRREHQHFKTGPNAGGVAELGHGLAALPAQKFVEHCPCTKETEGCVAHPCRRKVERPGADFMEPQALSRSWRAVNFTDEANFL